MSDPWTYNFNWRWAWNIAIFGLHNWLTGHPVFVDILNGKPFCRSCPKHIKAK